MTKDFFEIGDAYRASDLYPVGDKYRTVVAFDSIPAGILGVIESVDDGSPGEFDDTEIKIAFENGQCGSFTATEFDDCLEIDDRYEQDLAEAAMEYAAHYCG